MVTGPLPSCTTIASHRKPLAPAPPGSASAAAAVAGGAASVSGAAVLAPSSSAPAFLCASHESCATALPQGPRGYISTGGSTLLRTRRVRPGKLSTLQIPAWFHSSGQLRRARGWAGSGRRKSGTVGRWDGRQWAVRCVCAVMWCVVGDGRWAVSSWWAEWRAWCVVMGVGRWLVFNGAGTRVSHTRTRHLPRREERPAQTSHAW